MYHQPNQGSSAKEEVPYHDEPVSASAVSAGAVPAHAELHEWVTHLLEETLTRWRDALQRMPIVFSQKARVYRMAKLYHDQLDGICRATNSV